MSEGGAAATEYVLIMVLIVALIVAGIWAFGVALGDKYRHVCDTVC